MRQDTICVQGGWKPKKGEPRVLPIYQSTTFKYDTTEEMGRLFALEDNGYFYTRLQNPTNDCVAAKIAELEGGAAAMLTSSGQAANFYAVTNICEAGSHLVSVRLSFDSVLRRDEKTDQEGIPVFFLSVLSGTFVDFWDYQGGFFGQLMI